MIFIRDKNGNFVSPDGKNILRTHVVNLDCLALGCAIHNPDEASHINKEQWPYNWRTDNGVMERVCIHGVGHPDPDAVRFHTRNGHEWVAVHGCDGCCGGDEAYARLQHGERRDTYDKH